MPLVESLWRIAIDYAAGWREIDSGLPQHRPTNITHGLILVGFPASYLLGTMLPKADSPKIVGSICHSAMELGL